MNEFLKKEELKATAGSWKCIPFSNSKKIECNIFLTKEEFEIIAKGFIPRVMEDHWFMYCDNETINYFRSWTGKQIFKGYYKKDGDLYVIYLLETDNNTDEDNKIIKTFSDLLKDHCKYLR